MRQLQFWVTPNERQLATIPCSIWIGGGRPSFEVPFQSFQKVQNLLGQEFNQIIFDAREGFHLEALAIASGTLKEGGTLTVLLKDWENLAQQPDIDSLRWNGDNQAIATPYFIQHLKKLVEQYQFPVFTQMPPTLSITQCAVTFSEDSPCYIATQAQKAAIEKIQQRQTDLYFITAKRGRGKSALLGLLANQLADKIYLTAPNKSAVKTLLSFCNKQIEFIAPDELVMQLAQTPTAFKDCWLLVDEAAMIPLPLLDSFTKQFKHLVFSSTIHSYEGTGRGFILKFRDKTHRTFSHIELTYPLRWQPNDLVEKFIDDLLLLNAEDHIAAIPYQANPSMSFHSVPPSQLQNQLHDFYGLLTLAHYRTSPLDLRRLLDAHKQLVYLAQTDLHLLGGLWALQEGGLEDQALIRQICRGQRRPKGNLVPQLLAFNLNLPIACELKSQRISRIAIHPQWQRQHIGSRLINKLKQEQQTQLDFLSTSFGYTPELAQFWEKNGFRLVHIGEHKESRSGCYSAVAVYPFSQAGYHFCQLAEKRFQRHISLSWHPLATELSDLPPDWEFTNEDWQSLQHFAYFHRSLSMTLPAIQRLIRQLPPSACPKLRGYLTQRKTRFELGQQVEIHQFREEIKTILTENREEHELFNQ